MVQLTGMGWGISAIEDGEIQKSRAGLIRTGGVFAQAEFMAMVDLPTIGKAMAELRHGRATAQHGNRGPSWDEWWELAAADPELRNAFASRSEIFEATYTLEEFSPPADWHTRALVEAGFKELERCFVPVTAPSLPQCAEMADLNITLRPFREG